MPLIHDTQVPEVRFSVKFGYLRHASGLLFLSRKRYPHAALHMFGCLVNNLLCLWRNKLLILQSSISWHTSRADKKPRRKTRPGFFSYWGQFCQLTWSGRLDTRHYPCQNSNNLHFSEDSDKTLLLKNNQKHADLGENHVFQPLSFHNYFDNVFFFATDCCHQLFIFQRQHSD